MIFFIRSAKSTVIADLYQTAIRGAVRSDSKHAFCGAVCSYIFSRAVRGAVAVLQKPVRAQIFTPHRALLHDYVPMYGAVYL